MKVLRSLVLLLAMTPLPGRAAFTDFDSLVLGTEYPTGEAFMSDELSFSTVDFIGASGIVRVQNSIHAGGSGLELSILGGLNFSIPVGTPQISMRYNSADPNTGLIINGVATSLGLGFERLDGTSIGDVLISTDVTMPFEQGVLTLDGPINSFVIGGVELLIDDVSITAVPEPSSALLCIAVTVSLFTRWRRM